MFNIRTLAFSPPRSTVQPDSWGVVVGTTKSRSMIYVPSETRGNEDNGGRYNRGVRIGMGRRWRLGMRKEGISTRGATSGNAEHGVGGGGLHRGRNLFSEAL